MDILNLGSKIIIGLFFVLLVSCNGEKNKKGKITDSTVIVETSKQIIGKMQYEKILRQINDSIHVWSEFKLSDWRSIWGLKYQLDSILCFNVNKDQMVGSVLVQCNQNDCLQDDVHLIYGVKLNEGWYFFKGADITLPREAYQNNLHVPLSFIKLHEIAVKEIYSGYLTTEGEINEGFFNVFKKDAYNLSFTTKETWEASYLKLVAENWNKRDTAKPTIRLNKKEPLP